MELYVLINKIHFTLTHIQYERRTCVLFITVLSLQLTQSVQQFQTLSVVVVVVVVVVFVVTSFSGVGIKAEHSCRLVTII